MKKIIQKNYKAVLDEINETIYKYNRKNVKLIAVSKTFPKEFIEYCYESGQKLFGENKAQELKNKSEFFSNHKDIEWHFIGQLQTNKIKYIVPICEYIHSVYREKELIEIDKKAKKFNKKQKILIEINSGEDSKSGIAIEQFDYFYELSKKYENIIVSGLMTVPPYTQDKEKLKEIFNSLKNIRDKIYIKDTNFKELSFGMSNDFKIAIECGATFLRIGSKIFGNRNYGSGV
ncbi:YggS family pyridoxal phosphate enzyme [Tepiditoga spiralis]|uniref:Pyridoxal phosphate homeostasis protein n=1 Tax=Tepiditoga spiralis TaxID=2108365 RepID=A0A7G1G835_9BACT|nr:YggS family pyridoxal phosphate-dependent enzyme [Tepiditoga spiralis]BBE31107.1 YggS family pyridoxal phosphate enzyme [Tepiditoga spiralis]